MKKIIYLFLALGIFQVNAGNFVEECTVTAPYECVELLDLNIDLREDYQEDRRYISLIAQVKCLVNNTEDDPSVMADPEFKIFLAVHRFIDVETFLKVLETEKGVKVFNFVPTDMIPDYISFEKGHSCMCSLIR